MRKESCRLEILTHEKTLQVKTNYDKIHRESIYVRIIEIKVYIGGVMSGKRKRSIIYVKNRGRKPKALITFGGGKLNFL